MSIYLKTEDEIELMRRANGLVSRTLGIVGENIKPGVSTKQLDEIAETFMRDNGGEPLFKNFPNPLGKPFPASICTSVNDVVVHGIPSDSDVLRDGDIISVDCGVKIGGYCGDACYTFGVGEISGDTRRLLTATMEALSAAIATATTGHRLGDVSHAIQQSAEKNGYSVVRPLTGHGIGREMHEEPQVRNYGSEGTGPMLKTGMCIAIEPILTAGSPKVMLMHDRWTIRTADGGLAAHFEHTIAIRRGQAEILSSFAEAEQQERTH